MFLNYYLRFSRKLHAGSVSLQSLSVHQARLCTVSAGRLPTPLRHSCHPPSWFGDAMNFWQLCWTTEVLIKHWQNDYTIQSNPIIILTHHYKYITLQKQLAVGVIVHKHPKVWITEGLSVLPILSTRFGCSIFLNWSGLELLPGIFLNFIQSQLVVSSCLLSLS